MGLNLQPQTDQSRPTEPDTNPHIRKETKAIEKRKKLIPTKKYKVKLVARPKSKTSNATMKPTVTTTNAPTSSESQKPSQGGTSENNPHHSKHPNSCWHPMAQSRKDVMESPQMRKDWPIPPTPNATTSSKPPIK